MSFSSRCAHTGSTHSTLPKIGLAAALLALASLPSRAEFPVIAYFPNWVGAPTNVEFDKLTHVNYSFVLTNNNGTLNGPNDGLLKSMVTAAHAKGCKAGVAIGGWNDGNTAPFEAMAANATSRAAFITNVIAMCDKYSLDGIDMDWEYPKASSVANYTTMMKELSVELKKKNRFLSAAVISSGNGTGQYITKEVIDVLDYLNIMAYDAGGANHTSYAVATTALDYWVTQRGTPKQKAILGLGFYGRDANGGSYTDYKVILSRDPQAYTKDLSGGLGYNGVPTIEKKVDLAAQRAGGVMIWEISQDTHDDQTSLLRAIDRKVMQMPVALRGPGAGMTVREAGISLVAAPGIIRVSGAPQGMLTLRLRTVEGRLLYESPLLANARGEASVAWNRGGARRGIYFASLEGRSGLLMNSILPLSR